MPAQNRRISAPKRGPGRVLSRPARTRGARPAALSGPHAIELAGLLHELSVRLLGAEGFDAALERLASFVVAAVPGTVRCSVALIGEGGPLTCTASGPCGEGVDELQYALSTGPGLDAARTRALITVTDLATDDRWPALAEPARAEGVRSVVAVPLDVPRAEVGAVSLYRDGSGGLVPDLLLTAMALVNQAEVLLGELRRRDETSTDAVVDRAVGVIIAQRGCGVREAYDVLSETAQRLGLDRRAVADRLIAAAARNA
ncbi:GAF and ANTAR domain-containing protein [Paractinoplanes globisporus]|uniref:ANTAR domain-containing protein n=1 Tax=Paractinoplanes globisporus TaxID=113565 RepID=A0ABW6WFH4_9ACTN|nr:GAF and ANTAR domain-containing protein [Actinoplanes globisporus]